MKPNEIERYIIELNPSILLHFSIKKNVQQQNNLFLVEFKTPTNVLICQSN